MNTADLNILIQALTTVEKQRERRERAKITNLAKREQKVEWIRRALIWLKANQAVDDIITFQQFTMLAKALWGYREQRPIGRGRMIQLSEDYPSFFRTYRPVGATYPTGITLVGQNN